MMRVVALGVLGGVLLRGIYSVLRFRRRALESPIEYMQMPEELHYLTTDEILINSAKFRWIRYLLFRTLPVILVLSLITGIFQQNEFSRRYLLISFVLTFIVYYVPGIVKIIIRKHREYSSVRILKISLFLLNIVLLLIIFGLSFCVNFSYITPTFSGIKDNIWSALFAAVIVAWYLEMTNMGHSNAFDEAARTNTMFIRQQGEIIYGRYGEVIGRVSEKNGVSSSVMQAILVYENLNRPLIIRKLENLLVRLFRTSMTVGIAQVMSNRPLTDEESIEKMGVILRDIFKKVKEESNPQRMLSQALTEYNDSKYAQNVIKIIDILSPTWPSDFHV